MNEVASAATAGDPLAELDAQIAALDAASAQPDSRVAAIDVERVLWPNVPPEAIAARPAHERLAVLRKHRTDRVAREQAERRDLAARAPRPSLDRPFARLGEAKARREAAQERAAQVRRRREEIAAEIAELRAQIADLGTGTPRNIDEILTGGAAPSAAELRKSAEEAFTLQASITHYEAQVSALKLEEVNCARAEEAAARNVSEAETACLRVLEAELLAQYEEAAFRLVAEVFVPLSAIGRALDSRGETTVISNLVGALKLPARPAESTLSEPPLLTYGYELTPEAPAELRESAGEWAVGFAPELINERADAEASAPAQDTTGGL